MIEEGLVGTWRQISYIENGMDLPSDAETFVSLDRNNFTVTLSNGTVIISGTYRVDRAKNPKAIDWTDTFGADAGKTFLAIYTLEGDSFAFCAADEGMQRPKSFAPIPGHTIRSFNRI